MNRWLAKQDANPGRRLELDGIRALAVLMVVCIHAAGQYTYVASGLDAGWWCALIMDSLSRTCVPWFVMISGCLLLGGRPMDGVGVFYRKRLARLLIPFLFWAAIYLSWRRYVHGDTSGLGELLVEIVTGPVYFHMWYLYMVAGLFAAAPFLGRMVAALTDREALWFIGVWFCGASLLPYYEWLVRAEVTVPLGWFGSFFGLFAAGAVSRRFRIPTELRPRVGMLLSVLMLLTIGATVYLSWRSKMLNETALLYLAPNILGLAVGGYMWLRDCDWSWLGGSGPAPRLIRYVSRRSLPIYLAHVVLLELLAPTVFSATVKVPLLAPPLLSLLTLIATLAVVRVGGGIPGLRVVFK